MYLYFLLSRFYTTTTALRRADMLTESKGIKKGDGTIKQKCGNLF